MAKAKTTTKKKPATKKAPAKKEPAKKEPAKKKPKKKLTSAQAVMAHLKAKEKKAKVKVSAISTLEAGFTDGIEPLRTGMEVIDHYICGIGGLPIGRIVEIFSDEGAGKSSAALQFLGQAQRDGATTTLVETERGFMKQRARVLGVDPENLILVRPTHLEHALATIEGVFDALDPSLGPALVVFDSLAATPTKAEVEEGVSEKMRVGGCSKIMSQSMRILTAKVEASRATLLIVNQTRDSIGGFGGGKITPGGTALKFHCSLRLGIWGGKAVKDKAGNHIGKDVTIAVAKTRLTEPNRKARLRFMYKTGWDNDWSVLNLAKDMKLVAPRSQSVDEARAKLNEANWDYWDAAAMVAAGKGDSTDLSSDDLCDD